ncbi:NUDIX domain-containing protein [Arachidicoccus sp.]|uniref:NUDIX domain-containing protein n=1 Tax=Arachidicoccus sp. TaxID=1872624 RepID=UPI003D1AF427
MNSFNVRVYGLLIDELNNRILVSDEFIRGDYITKFPGGGLELGEGTRNCLVREFKEETDLDVTIGEHFYTTDFFQQSAFNKAHQIISIYYLVKCKELDKLITHQESFEFAPAQIADINGSSEVFRWVEFSDLSEESVTLPIDKVVVKNLLSSNLFSKPSTKKYFIQNHPFVVPTTDGKLIEEHFGLASTGETRISVAHMIAPPNWTEPHQVPGFDEWTLIVSGKKSIEIDDETVTLQVGQSILIEKGARIKYSNPFAESCEYWSVCLPAFSVDKVNREEG